MVPDHLAELIRELRNAYSGELAAAYAYRGHWHSVRDAADRARIRQIEGEEWHHRRTVGGILRDLGAAPNGLREVIFFAIGRTVGLLCHVGGRFLPMYGAGFLERRNIGEYERAAVHAYHCGHQELIDCILTMAEVEWEHERYFREKVTGHRGLHLLGLWEAPPAKETIRAPFRAELAAERSALRF
jgi:rubrerythrin